VNRESKYVKCLVAAVLLMGVCGYAQEAKKDNTGTNPINFTYDLRAYYNYADLNTAGDGESQTTTLEFRVPLSETWAFRTRLRGVDKRIDSTGDGVRDIDESGFGDVDIRFLNVPYVNMQKKFAFAWGLEATFDTADDLLGGGSTTLGPQVFAVFFKPIGGGDLFAPAYQHVFDIDGNKVNRGLIDIFYLYTFKTSFFNWVLVNPQAVIDFENDNTASWNIDCEAGKMLSQNQSCYLRPGVGVGDDRLFDLDVELGWKLVW
jgi:hypothetical protein